MSTYRAIAREVDAVQFDGQALPGVELQYLGSDDVGLPLYQGIVRFQGGEATLYRGDWLVDGKVYTAAEFKARFEDAALANPNMPPGSPPVQIVRLDPMPTTPDEKQALIDKLRGQIAELYKELP